MAGVRSRSDPRLCWSGNVSITECRHLHQHSVHVSVYLGVSLQFNYPMILQTYAVIRRMDAAKKWKSSILPKFEWFRVMLYSNRNFGNASRFRYITLDTLPALQLKSCIVEFLGNIMIPRWVNKSFKKLLEVQNFNRNVILNSSFSRRFSDLLQYEYIIHLIMSFTWKFHVLRYANSAWTIHNYRLKLGRD